MNPSLSHTEVWDSVKHKVLDLHSQKLKNILWKLQSNSTEI